MSTYSAPVSQLLSLGEPGSRAWRDYMALGIGNDHIADLIRMAGDEELHNADGGSPLVWAPLHAWRALGRIACRGGNRRAAGLAATRRRPR